MASNDSRVTHKLGPSLTRNTHIMSMFSTDSLFRFENKVACTRVNWQADKDRYEAVSRQLLRFLDQLCKNITILNVTVMSINCADDYTSFDTDCPHLWWTCKLLSSTLAVLEVFWNDLSNECVVGIKDISHCSSDKHDTVIFMHGGFWSWAEPCWAMAQSCSQTCAKSFPVSSALPPFSGNDVSLPQFFPLISNSIMIHLAWTNMLYTYMCIDNRLQLTVVCKTVAAFWRHHQHYWCYL